MMSLKTRDYMRRFIALVDTLYDQKAKLLILADAPLDGLFVTTEEEGEDRSHGLLMDDLGIKPGDVSMRF